MSELTFKKDRGALYCVDEDFFYEYEIQFANGKCLLRVNGEIKGSFDSTKSAIKYAKSLHRENYQ